MSIPVTDAADAPSTTNARIGEVLGLSHSAVSRMRRGERLGSVEVWRKISAATGESLESVASSAQRAKSGEVGSWANLLLRCANDQE